MSDAAHRAWLEAQLPVLVDAGLIDEAAAAGIRAHYGSPEDLAAQRRNRLLAIFGSLGALLVGLGIILLVAFNWEQLSRPMRTLAALLPLVTGQGLVAYARARRADSTAWLEGTALATFLALGAAMALISQTYQVGGTVEGFMLVWALLGLPLAYVTGASLPALGYLACVMAWAGLRFGAPRLPAYSLLIVLVLPPLIARLRADRSSSRGALMLWLLTAALLEWMALLLDDLPQAWVLPALAAGLALIYLADGIVEPRGAVGLWHRPFQVLGGTGLAILGLLGSSFGFDLWRAAELDALGPAQGLTLVGLLLGAGLLLWRADPERRQAKLGLGLLPASVLLGTALTGLGAADGSDTGATLASLLLNLHLLAAGVWQIALGTRRNSLALANGGLGLVLLLVFFRFFEADLGLIGRGLAFIGLGICFILANVFIARRMRP
ncbi:MAG: DUF2157 domain-containing protein [Caldilineae bacterium]|nr:DUF2157 domain-containing protein [Chloroflexota bacterium]MCB9176525.1 DUF2157 domain-containing protein [Caldilineae bacterium]